jgi:hypothetical protein
MCNAVYGNLMFDGSEKSHGVKMEASTGQMGTCKPEAVDTPG